MLKKFVTVNADASPSQNPYEVRTYCGEANGLEWNLNSLPPRDRKCLKPNSTISHVLTIEDEIRRLHQKAEQSRFYRPIKKRCELYDEFTMCVMPQRTPEELKLHAEMRERLLLEKCDFGLIEHDARAIKPSKDKAADVVMLNSPMNIKGEEEEEAGEMEELEEESEVKPQLASPECTSDAIIIPNKRLLELKRPKSRIFINETRVGPLEDLPFEPYNPRELQEELDAENIRRYDLIEGCAPHDLWTWNVGLQKRESELDHAFIEASIPKFDQNLELTVYNVPKDLEKTFTAEIVFGGKCVPTDLEHRQGVYNRPFEIACIIVAYVESFRLNPDFWTASTMDGIITRGEKLLKKSVSLYYKSKNAQNDYDILPFVEEREASVTIRVHYTGRLNKEPNVYKVLSLFFTKFNACILVSKKLYLLIWKRCQNSYYIFDPNGRNELCQRDFEGGKCSLMATRFTEHLVHLIEKFSDANLDEEFNLYEINLHQYGKLKERTPPKEKEKVLHKLWAVVNEQYAVKPANNAGIGQPISGNEKNASLIVALIAYLYSEFEKPSLWSPMTLDDLIKYGVAYYRTLRKKFRLDGKRWKDKKPHLNVVDLPEMFLMGAYKATVRKHPFMITGHIADCKNYVDSQLTAGLQQLFNMPDWPAALLQIDNSVLGIWRDNEFFYVFDSFRRNKVGMVVDPDDYRIKGLAVLQLHTTFESFCRILYQNALKMRRGGKFFIHGIRMGCIRPLQVMTATKNKFPALKMGLPTYTDEPEPPEVQQKKSIQSILEDERVPLQDEQEVIEQLIIDIINEIIKEFPEPILQRPSMYRGAQRVLLRSDKEHLRALRLKIKRGYDVEEEPDEERHVLTLDEELQAPSNFLSLPDGTWVIFGTTQLPQLDEEMAKLGGILANLVAIALSAKYKISTWNADLIEFALESANQFGEDYQVYENILAALLNKRLPEIAIGQNQYDLEVTKIIKSNILTPLRQVLLESLINATRIMVICKHFSCAIIKRYNFLYMFIGFPCNAVGFRKFGSGPGCLLRFVELDSLIRRIEFGCNPEGCSVSDFVVVTLKVLDMTNHTRFRKWSPDDEEVEYQRELERRNEIKRRKQEKMRFINDELKKENKRIRDFMKAKKEREDRKKGIYREPYQTYIMGEGEEEELGMEQEEGEEETQIKHKPGKKLKKEIKGLYKPRPILYGYRMREKDCLFKIQGSMAMDSRDDGTIKVIKPCYFAAALAILNATLRPLNKWSSYRVDRVITTAKTIASRVCELESVFERVVRHVTVDDYEFDIWIRSLELPPPGAKSYKPPPAAMSGIIFARKLTKVLQTRKYLIIFTPNVSYALYHDEYYHLFDPYPSMETCGGEEEGDEGEEEEKKKCPKGPKRYPERNTASWVLFADVESMLTYIDPRCANGEWKESLQYKFYVVDILSYKKAAPNARILQLLTDMSIPMECSTKQFGRPEYEICATNESLGWLELENCLPVWSRLNRRNTAGAYRNIPVSKMKKYDIEIEGRLWSLWGNLHPEAPVFEADTRGRQYLACYVMACCAASIYNLMDWGPQVLDTIVIGGDKYFAESIATIPDPDYEFSLEDLNIDCSLETINFVVHIEHVAYGKLYRMPSYNRMNLAEALIYFFSHYQYGIVQVRQRAVAIGFSPGHEGGYFMYDCQEKDHPLFPKEQGASYLLRTRHLQVLLYCIVVTLNVPFYNIEFTIHKVEMLREGATVEDEGEGEEGEEEDQ